MSPKRKKRKRRSSQAGMAVYVRCTLCGAEFTGKSGTIEEWYKHLVLCRQNHSKKSKKK